MTYRRALFFYFAVFTTFFPAMAAAQSLAWTSLGPTNLGGPVSGIVIDPAAPTHLVVSGAGGGIWRSLDGGATWTPVDNLSVSSLKLTVYQLVAHPTQPGVIFAPSGSGLLKSTDAGETWSRIGTYNPRRLAISSDGQVMLAIGSDGTSRSTDQGVTWTLVLPMAVTDLQDSDVAFSPTDSQRAVTAGVLVPNLSSRYSYSTNAGLNWANSTSPTVMTCCPDNSRDAFAPGNPSVAYILNRTVTQVLRSSDGGASFEARSATNLPSALNDAPRRLALWVDPTNSETVVVAERDLWRSTDGGTTFTQISDWAVSPLTPGGQPNVIVSDPGFNGLSNRRVYVGTDAGLFRTDDIYAVTPSSGWTSLNNGLVLGSFVSVAAIYNGPVIGLTPDHGIWRIPAGSTVATRVGGSPFFPGYFTASPTGQVGVDAAGAGPFFFVDALGGSVYRSTNSGVSFTPLAQIPNTSSMRLVRPPIAGIVGLATQTGLFRSQDATSPVPTWQPVLAGIIGDAVYPAGNPDVQLVVRSSDGRLMESQNASAPTPAFSDVTPPGLANRIKSVLLASADGEVAYLTALVGTEWQIWGRRSRSEGFSNVSIPIAGLVVNALTVHPRDPRRLYAGTSFGLYLSVNGGSNWVFNFRNHANVTDLTWQDKRMIAATSGSGLWARDWPGTALLFIDTPPSESTRTEPFALSGWAIDREDTFSGVGMDGVFIYAIPSGGGAPIYLGAATTGLPRPDVAAVYGSRFLNAGYSMSISGLAPGTYDFVVYSHSAFSNQFNGMLRRVTIAPSVSVLVDQPVPGATLGLPVVVSGWAVDGAATSGTGIDAIVVWAVPSNGSPARYLGSATVGLSRPDVGNLLGSQFTNSGYTLTGTGVGPGAYQLVIYAHSTVSNSYTAKVVPITVVGPSVRAFIDAPSPNATVSPGTVLSGWAVDLATTSGTGVSTVQVWAVPTTPGPAIFVSTATYGQARPDVGAFFGSSSFTPSGYSLPINGLSPGTYDLLVFIFSDVSQSFASALAVRVTIQ